MWHKFQMPRGDAEQRRILGADGHVADCATLVLRRGLMVLRWMNGDDVVGESTFMPGKRLHLAAYRQLPVPETLQVYQVYSSAMRQILKHIGIPDRHPGQLFGAVRQDDEHYRSDARWRLPEPRGWRKSASFIFIANNSENTSGPIYSSRIGKASFKTKASAQAKAPAGVVLIGGGGEADVDIDVTFATDPVLTVEVLTGETLAEHMIRNLLEEVVPEGEAEREDLAGRVALELPRLRDSLPATYAAPSLWSFTTTSVEIQGDEGDHVTLGLHLEAPTPGSAYVAVSFTDPSNPDRGETCDPWGITVDEDLVVSAITDPNDLPLALPAFA